jgi:ElaB/YqjD/DUF883 family membrane-anchored ribosome-binding protein
MAIYPVQIPNRSTLYVEGTKSAIEAKLKSLGYKKYTITNPISKTKLVTNRLGKGKIGSIKPIKVGSIPAPSARTAGLGKGAGGPNNPGMKPDLEARSKLPDAVQKKKDAEAAKRKKQPPNKRGGSGNQTKKNVKPKAPVNKKTVGNQQKIKDLAKKVKARMPNVSMSKILDTIRTQIRKRPLTAVAGATGVGVAIGTILSALKPSKIEDATLTGNKLQVTNTKGGQKSKSKTPTKTKKPANPKVAITIATPLPRPKRDNGKKKKDKGGSGMMLSLIVGGKGTAAQRMKEIKAEKELEKKLGGRPTKKQLIAYLKKKN